MSFTPSNSPDDLDALMAPPPDGTAMFMNHKNLKGAPNIQGTLAPFVTFVSASVLRPGMVVPVVEAVDD